MDGNDELKKYGEINKTLTDYLTFLNQKVIPEMNAKIEEIRKSLDYVNKVSNNIAEIFAFKVPDLAKVAEILKLLQSEELQKLLAAVKEFSKAQQSLQSDVATSVSAGAPVSKQEPPKAEAKPEPKVEAKAEAKSEAKPEPKEIEISVEFRNAYYIALIQGPDPRYGFQRKFLTKHGEKVFKGKVPAGSVIEVKLPHPEGTKYFLVEAGGLKEVSKVEVGSYVGKLP